MVARLLWEQDVAGSNPVTPMPETSVLTVSVAASPGRLFYCLQSGVWSGCGQGTRKPSADHTTFRSSRPTSHHQRHNDFIVDTGRSPHCFTAVAGGCPAPRSLFPRQYTITSLVIVALEMVRTLRSCSTDGSVPPFTGSSELPRPARQHHKSHRQNGTLRFEGVTLQFPKSFFRDLGCPECSSPADVLPATKDVFAILREMAASHKKKRSALYLQTPS